MCVAMRSRNQRSWLITTAQPGKLSRGFLERPQGFHIEVVGRLVQKHDVGARPQHLGQVDPVAFAARQLPDPLLLVRTAEVEGADIGSALDLALVAEVDLVLALGDLFPDRLRAVEGVAALVDIAEADRLTDLEGAGTGLLLVRDHPEQGRLAGTVRADDADDAAGRQG